MSVHHLLTAAGATLTEGSGHAASAAAHVLAQPAGVGAYTLTAGRLWSLVAIVPALAGVVTGGLALRSAGRTDTTRKATAALASGLVGVVVGGLVVINSEGGPGTGGGIVGGYLALALGAAAMIVGWRALARSRRAA
ncbi:DUF6223 family protein [Streptosporangium sp. NPDC048047]|uniref:DUF6223 family protein n=1 Tax=Streptosporangium sp. NPDC048047 TaxID=3155748 RepID=UPI00342069E8